MYNIVLLMPQSSDSTAKNTIYAVKGLVSTATRRDTSSSPLMSPKNHKTITPHGEPSTSPTNLNTEQKHPQITKLKEAGGEESDNSLQCEIIHYVHIQLSQKL